MASARKISEVFYEVRARTEGLSRDLDDSQRQFGKLAKFIRDNPVAAIGGVATALSGVAIAAVKMASQVETSLRKVSAAVPAGAEGLKGLRQEIEQISVATGQSQEELAAVAASIARAGAGSAAEISVRLRAIVDAAQASGTDLQSIVGGLDQVLDLFGLTSTDAAQAVAELFDAARGRTTLDELFATLQAAAPGIQKLGLDLPTAARALVQLGESGLSAKQAAAELKRLADEGAAGRQEIEALARTLPRAVNPMLQLAQAAEDVNNSAANAASRIRQELNATLIALGNELLPAVNAGLQQLLRLFGRGQFNLTNLENAKAALLAFGDAQQQAFTGREQGAIEAQRAVKLLAEAAREGKVSFVDLGEEGVAQLQRRVDFFAKSRFLAGSIADIRILQNELKKAGAEATKVAKPLGKATAPLSGGESPEAKRQAAEAAKAREKAIDEANKALDAIKKKAEDNAATVQDAVAQAAVQLAQLAGDSVAVIDAQIAELTRKYQALGATSDDIAKIVAPLEAAKRAATALNGAATQIVIPPEVARELNRASGAAEETDASTRSLADHLSDVADLALGVATAFGGANAQLTRLLQGAAQLASSFSKIAELATAAGGLGTLLSSGSGLLSALPGIGGIIGGIGTLVSAFGATPEDPQLAEQIRLTRENNRRLADLRDGLAEVVLSLSGRTVAAIRDVATTGISVPEEGGLPGEGLLLVQDVLAALRKLGVGLEQLRRVAADFGIELSESPTTAEIQELQEAIRQFSLDALTNTIQGALKQLDLLAQVDPKRFGGIKGILKQVELFTDPKKGVPAIAAAIGDLDLTTAEGRAEAIKRLTAILEDIGSLDIGDLGGLNPDEFLAAIAKLITGLQDIGDAFSEFDTAVEALQATFDAGLIDAAAFFAKLKDLFAQKFPELFAGLDFSSLDDLKASIGTIIAGFAADGELSDAEKAQIAILQQLVAAFEATLPPIESVLEGLDLLAAQFELFGTSAADQFAATFAELLKKFPELGDLIDPADIATPEGRERIKRAIRDWFTKASADGLDESEQAFFDALKRLFGLVTTVGNEAETEAERLARERRAKQQAILDAAESLIKLNDVTDPIEQLRIRVGAVAQAFPELADALAQFDLATQAGRDAFAAWVKQLGNSPEALKSLAEATGLTIEQLLAMLIGLKDGAGAAATAIETLADKLRAAFEEADWEIALNAITDPLEQLTVKARAAAKVLPEIAKALAGLDLTSASGRAAAEQRLVALGSVTTDPAVRDAILSILNGIRAVNAQVADATQAAQEAATPAASQTLQGTPQITAIQADRWLDIARTQATLLREIAANTLAVATAFPRVDPATLLRPPALAAAGAAGGTTVQVRVQQTNYFDGAVTQDTRTRALDLTDDLIRRISEGLQRLATRERLNAGDTAR